jgi:hypothetical protein
LGPAGTTSGEPPRICRNVCLIRGHAIVPKIRAIAAFSWAGMIVPPGPGWASLMSAVTIAQIIVRHATTSPSIAETSA